MKIEDLIERNPEKMGGTPVFAGTRVPIKQLFDYLGHGESLEEFLDQFPEVSRDQVLAVLNTSREALLSAPASTQAGMELMREAAKDGFFPGDLNALEGSQGADHEEAGGRNRRQQKAVHRFHRFRRFLSAAVSRNRRDTIHAHYTKRH